MLVLMLAVACGGSAKKEDTTSGGGAGGDDKSLYDRLGGKDAITAVIDDFVNTAAADERISDFFKNSDAADLKAKLVDQVCEATGGPCRYTGKDMKTAHTGMKITEEHFNALVEDLVKSLDKFNVGQREKDELLGALGGMKGDIVGQ
ncbi:MAG TPA: group 1 truncated hemoglobin [Kofleriaceae bacterium]|nr:group 1 truncated hemoglobin [Kofleriaceae bacterium]